MPDAKRLLRVQRLTKRYETGAGPVWVLDGIELEISRGESVAIVGPSGSGKSTLLQIIGTLDAPTSGQVALDGRDLYSLDDRQLAQIRNAEIGFVFQAHYLLPQCTAWENVLLPTLAAVPQTGFPSAGNLQPSTFNAQSPRARHWACEVERWTWNVFHRFRGSKRELFRSESFPLEPAGKVGPHCAQPGAGAPVPYQIQGCTARSRASENSPPEPGDKVGPRCARPGAGAPAPYQVQGFNARNRVSENSPPEPLPPDRAQRLLDRVGLGGRLAHFPGQLSGGERQRVAVVRALINQPKLLLADEPTGALDHASATSLGRLLVELNREEGVTLIVVTHSLELARRMNRVLRLEQGQLVEEPMR
jgi:predicted ABC-type transport system involved in lysophospholipase L1 biosynthesis ATPase subunit